MEAQPIFDQSLTVYFMVNFMRLVKICNVLCFFIPENVILRKPWFWIYVNGPISAFECDVPGNEVFNNCGNSCLQTCTNALYPDVNCERKCYKGCERKSGYAKTIDGKCIPKNTCKDGKCNPFQVKENVFLND